MITKLLATGALAGALLLAGGSAAMASPAPYTGSQVETGTVAAGGTITFVSDPTELEPGTPITVTVTPSTGVTVSGNVVVASDGTFTFSVTTPANAPAGTVYTVVATGTDGEGDTYTLNGTVTIAGAPAAGAGTGGGAALPTTGGADTSAVLWFGAGALALGGAAIAVAAVTRRKAAQN